MSADLSTTLLRQRRSLEIVSEAYDVPLAEREAFLREACGEDAALRRAVDALLAVDEQSDAFLDGGMLGVLDANPPPAEDVGGYRVIGELGRGGMGVVYAAERADGTFEKTVALKLVQAAKASPETVRRFERERRVLARLDHPGIARLLDGGLTPDGRPYFIMERVDGQPLTTYADARGLDLTARLRLFLDVCDAVASAHRLLIVHRDLKPSNILVASGESQDGRDEENGPASGARGGAGAPSPQNPAAPASGADGAPRVKLLDFGIAKALDEDDEDVLTRTGGALTPAYAAPEQVGGEPITASTDVYALGVILYELLVGRRPYSFPNAAPAEVARIVREAEPTRPSDAASERGADRAPEASGVHAGATPARLRGDLDAIVLTALRKEPERRYASAAALADDLRRYLDGRPVTARGDALSYRASRFVRRHRLAVGAGGALVLALLVGVGAVLWQARETAREATRANVTLEYVLGMFEAVDPVALEGGDLTPEALLAPGLRRAAALDGQPLVQASLLEGLGRLGVSLGLFTTADSVLQRAVALRRAEQGRAHPDIGLPLTLLTRSRTAEGRYEEARAAGEEAVRLLASGGRPGALAEAQVYLAEVLYREREDDAAKALYRAAAGAGAPPATTVQALLGLAVLLDEADSLDAALPLFRRATALAQEAFGPTDPRTADAFYAHAETVARTENAEQARTLHERALAIYERAYGRGDYRTAQSLYTLAVFHDSRDPQEAERYYRAALRAYEASTLDEDHLWREYARVGLGGLLLRTDRPAEALPLVSAGAEAFATDLGADDPRTLSARAQRAAALIATGREGEGIRLLREVDAVLAASEPAGAFRLRVLERLEAALAATGRTPEARAVATRRASLGGA
ncbi:serine/threonine-protein kinase [Rubricoccus marinus]|uniref:Protein kinase domain-containing protein n=1 Tax=Rubricoccus marinus TaxID=716817 RepID=A0A259TV97_9BACT|nr:serine/threonine-protein kinase [Rubricoccus marinus]OZC01689.1 hypothetical protein BSZ36_01035 [Rubricoccus marinus]